MLTQTISSYVDLFAPPNVSRLPQFKLQLCLESDQIEFYPSLSDLEATLFSVVYTVATAMNNVPNIQVSQLTHMCNWCVNKDVFEQKLSNVCRQFFPCACHLAKVDIRLLIDKIDR